MSPSRQDLLLSRLNDIGASLAHSNRAVALIGLGSVGIEVDRLDKFSDLDFFAIVESDYKAEFIEHLDWLGSICPIAYSFRNTPDGHKLLFLDGVFCEFAVFEERELPEIPFAPGRIIWRKQGVPDTLALPQRVHSVLRESVFGMVVRRSTDESLRRGKPLSSWRKAVCDAPDSGLCG